MLTGYMGMLNAVGCVCGAGLASFVVFIPRLGSENTLRAGAVALAVWRHSVRGGRRAAEDEGICGAGASNLDSRAERFRNVSRRKS